MRFTTTECHQHDTKQSSLTSYSIEQMVVSQNPRKPGIKTKTNANSKRMVSMPILSSPFNQGCQPSSTTAPKMTKLFRGSPFNKISRFRVLTVRRPKRTSMQSNICSPSSNATYGVGKHSAPCWLVVVGVEGETCRKKYVFFRGLHTLPHFGGSTSLTY